MLFSPALSVTKMLGRKRVSRLSSDVQAGQVQPITGIPKLVPDPVTMIFILLLPNSVGDARKEKRLPQLKHSDCRVCRKLE